MSSRETDVHASEDAAPWQELASLVENGETSGLQQFVGELPASELALTMSRLTAEQQSAVVTALEPIDAASLVEQLPHAQALELIERLEPETAAAILEELPSNEQADLIGEMDDVDAEAILRRMDPSDAESARALSHYEDDVAGGMMVTEFLRYSDQWTVTQVVDDLRQRADEYRDYDVQYAYACDAEGRLTGVLRLRDLLLARPAQRIADLMIRQPVSVRDSTTLDELADLFERHHYLGVPVVDSEGRLVGVVREAAVAEAWSERQDNDYLKSQGIVGGEELRSMPLLRRSSRRLAWLSVNIVLNIIAASVIAVFQDTLSSVIALAVFLPIISDMSGCSGNQAVAVSMRELSLGLIRPHEVWRVWCQEVVLGIVNGLALGLLVAAVAFAWKGNLYLGLVVGLALCLNTIVAVSIGGLIPLVLKQLKVDPAVASGPLLTTITDMCGFFLILGIATLLLSRLAG
ncbi:MAG: magnesium transporter [Pirellulaceae bacterium]|nr:magnesium transporter [Pirellulaceae bacterium]